MAKVVVILLCGAQASGKSTYADQLKQKGMKVHSRDYARARMRRIDPSVSEDTIWQALLDQAAADVLSGCGVVLDSTLGSVDRRDKAIAFFQALDCDVVIYWIRTPLTECHKRNNQRQKAKVRPGDIDVTHARINEAFALNPPSCAVVEFFA